MISMFSSLLMISIFRLSFSWFQMNVIHHSISWFQFLPSLVLINDFHYFNAFIIHSHKLYFFFFSSRSCMFILSWFIMKWCFIAAMLNNSNSTSTRPSTGMFHIAINRSDKTLGHLCTCRSRSVHIYFCSNLTIRHHCFLRFIC